MTPFSPAVLGIGYGLSEIGISLWKRARSDSKAADQGSLRLLWIVIIVSVTLAVFASQALPQANSALLGRLHATGVALFFGGLILRWYSILYLGRFFTVNVAIAADHKVVDTGPYRLLRHPSYTGALIAFVGLGICYGNWASLLILTVPFGLAILRRIAVEEAALTRALGPAYEAYAARTRRLIPFVY